jgi:hypothetical protein
MQYQDIHTSAFIAVMYDKHLIWSPMTDAVAVSQRFGPAYAKTRTAFVT